MPSAYSLFTNLSDINSQPLTQLGQNVTLNEDEILCKPGVQICVIVRTHEGQVGFLWNLLSSIAINRVVTWSIIVLNTDSIAGHESIKERIEQYKRSQPESVQSRIKLHPYIKSNLTSQLPDYGYESTQYALDEIMRAPNPPEYLLFTNGDNVYMNNAFLEARDSMEKGMDLIAFSYVSNSKHRKRGSIGAQFINECAFKHGRLDLGSTLIRTAKIRGTRFTTVLDPCSAKYGIPPCNMFKCTAEDPRPYWCADWGFFFQLLKEGASHTCLRGRPLMIAN